MDPTQRLGEDPQALGALLEQHRRRLRRMVQLRMDQRARGGSIHPM